MLRLLSFILSFAVLCGAAELDTIVFQLKWNHQFQFAGFYAAQHQGFYAEEGLYVQFRTLDSALSTVEAVSLGKAQYGVHSIDIIKAWEKRKTVVSLAVIFQSSPAILLTQPDFIIPSQLKDRKLYLGRHQAVELLAMLAKKGVSMPSLQTVEYLKNPVEIFAQGEIDGIQGTIGKEPEILSRKHVGFNVLRPSRYGLYFYGDCLFTTYYELESNPERVRKLVRASLKGWEYAFSHVDRTIDVILEHYAPELDRKALEVEAKALAELNGTQQKVPFGSQNLSLWQRDADVLWKLGLLKDSLDVSPYVIDLEQLEASKRNKQIWQLGVLVAASSVFLALLGIVTWFLWYRHRINMRKLQENEARLQQALSSTMDAVWDWSDPEQPMWWSETGYKLFRVDHHFQPTWSNIADVLHPEDRDNVYATLTQARERRTSFEIDFRICIGEDFQYLRMKGGASSYNKPFSFSGLFQDVHHLKMANLALQQSEARFRQYFELGLVGMATVDKEGRFEEANKTLAQMLGYEEPEQLLGIKWQDLTHPKDLMLEEDLQESVFRHERVGYHLDKRFLNRSGKTIYTIVSVRGVMVDDHFAHWVMLFQDITRRRQGEQEKEMILHQLSLKNRTLESMLYSLGNDFRSPLVTVMWFIDEMEKSQKALIEHGNSEALTEEILTGLRSQSETIAAIRKGSLKIDRMLSGILHLARLGRQNMEPALLDMNQIVSGVLNDMKPAIEKAGCIVETRQLPEAMGSEALIYDVWKELVTNAINFRDPLREIHLYITGRKVGDWVAYSLEDTGIGIPRSGLGNIFSPFFKLQAFENTETIGGGEGLGLSIVTRILESHRGHITVDSEVGKGTHFTFYLPRKSSENE